MNRIIVSPKALAVARELRLLMAPQADVVAEEVVVSDLELAGTVGLRPDSVYRALVELSRHGAIWVCRATGGTRALTLLTGHWLWASLAQSGPEGGER